MEPDSVISLMACIDEVQKKGRGAYSGRAQVKEKFNRDVLARGMLEVLGRVAGCGLALDSR